jgi:endonuclease YncB( thermonuclease family)
MHLSLLPLLAVLLLVPGGARSDDCPGVGGQPAVVAEAIDGDTVRLGDGTVVRLAGVEAPKRPLSTEDDEPWPLADDSRRGLASLVAGQKVRVAWIGTEADRHGRLHARLVLADGRWVEAELVTAGLGRVRWLPGEGLCFQALLEREAEARRSAVGLWADPAYAVLSAGDPSLRSRNGLYELVQGRVNSVGHGYRMVFLDFGSNARSDFTAMIPPEAAERLTAEGMPPDSFAGRRVRVRGVIEESGGPAIRINDPAEIELID